MNALDAGIMPWLRSEARTVPDTARVAWSVTIPADSTAVTTRSAPAEGPSSASPES